MLNNRKLALLFFVTIVMCFGCRKPPKDDNPIGTVVIGNTTPGQVTISGTVTKSDGTAGDNATVTIGSATVTTAANGSYSFSGVVPDSNKVVIKFSKPGYADTWQTLAVETNAAYSNINAVFVVPATTSFNALTGGTVTISPIGLTMTFAANSVVRTDGTGYTGTVVVTTPNTLSVSISNILPGDARAIDAVNNQEVLESFAGWYVTLKGQAGELLTLSKPMTYSYPTADANAPASLKLWYFNDITGLWAESAPAMLVNKAFVGSTSNTGFLQLAVPYASTLYRLTIKDAFNNAPFGFVMGSTATPNYVLDRYTGYQRATVNSKGICLLYVPAAVGLYLSLSSRCDQAYSGTVTPLPPGVKTEKSITPVLTKYLTSITGQVQDCTFQPINGTAQLTVNGVVYTQTLTDGVYKFNVLACGNYYSLNANLTVYDASNKVIIQNPYIVVIVGSTYQVPAISPCTNPITGYFTYTVAGQTYTLSTPKDSLFYTTGYDVVSAKMYTNIRAVGVGKGASLTTLNLSAGTYTAYTGGFYGSAGNNYGITWGLFTPGNVIYTTYRSGTTIAEGTFDTNTTLNFCLGCPNTTVEVRGSFKLSQ